MRPDIEVTIAGKKHQISCWFHNEADHDANGRCLCEDGDECRGFGWYWLDRANPTGLPAGARPGPPDPIGPFETAAEALADAASRIASNESTLMARLRARRRARERKEKTMASTLIRGKTPPRGVFQGRNIMTPEWMEYGQIRPGVWYELSHGRGMDGEPIFGVTIRAAHGRGIADAPSKLCHSRAQAHAYLEMLAER